ncbi:MAG: hypothetical protein LBV03_04025 [Fusobacteriales bacterium]|nr:hypothetical protein [Fusobacteriales bacterium]
MISFLDINLLIVLCGGAEEPESSHIKLISLLHAFSIFLEEYTIIHKSIN